MSETRATYDVAEPPSANGTAPRMQPRYLWLDVPEYAGFKVKAWSNAPRRVFLDLDSGEAERFAGAIRALLVEHNGWCDCDGAPLPPLDDPTFLDVVPTELLGMALRAARVEGPFALGNSLALKRRASASG